MRRHAISPSEKSVVRSVNQPVKNNFQNRVLASIMGAGCFVVICTETEGVILLSPNYFSKGQIQRLNFLYGVIWKLIYSLRGE